MRTRALALMPARGGYHGAHFRRLSARRKAISPRGKMEVAVAIGTDPAITFSAIVPAPPDVEEYLIAGFLRQKPVELVKCETVDLEVPANAEIVLEGYVHLDELRTEGPFGDHTGFYSLEDLYPVFTSPASRIARIRSTRPPSWASRRMEDGWMGKAVERIFLPLMRLTIPELSTSIFRSKASFTT